MLTTDCRFNVVGLFFSQHFIHQIEILAQIYTFGIQVNAQIASRFIGYSTQIVPRFHYHHLRPNIVDGRLIDDELERIWKEMITAQSFNVPTFIRRGRGERYR